MLIALAVASEVKKLMGEMSAKFPDGMRYTALLDSSQFIEDSIHGVYKALIEAGILVLIVIMVFLQNMRAMLGAGGDRAGHDHRRFHCDGASRFHRQSDDVVRSHPRHRHRR